MARRHPAIDPQVGDELGTSSMVRRVTGRDVGDSVVFNWHNPAKPTLEAQAICRLGCWQRWARDAKVIVSPGWPPKPPKEAAQSTG